MNPRLIYPTTCANKETDLLWISPLGYSNSFSYVSKLIIPNLAKKDPDLKIKVMCLGMTYAPEEAKTFGLDSFTLPVLTKNSLGFTDVDKIWFQDFLVGQFTIPALITYLNPKLVISLYDGGPLIKQLKSIKDLHVRFIPYFPIDSEISMIDKTILKCDSILTMSEHSRKMLINQGAKDVTVIPHIILPRAKKVEQMKHNRIIVGTVNANHNRKRLNLVAEAFINIYNLGKKVGLLIKTTPASNEKFSTHWCRSYDIELLKDYIKSKCKDIDMLTVRFITKVLSDEELRSVYSEIDVFIHVSSGEGFGLTPLEAVLIGDCLPIVANNTSMPYLFGNDYFGLVKCRPHPYYHDDSKGTYRCIMKCYVSSEFSIKYGYLNISQFNTIIVIDPSGYQFKEALKTPSKIKFDKYKPTEIIHLRNLQDLLNNIELFSNIFPFFQVLILDTQKFISEQLEMKILGNEDRAKEIWRIKKASKVNLHMCTFKDLTSKITSRDGICAIPNIEDIMTKINILFNMNNKDETLVKLKRKISSICDADMITEKLSIFIRSKMI
uniref:Glycosyltransferase n=1 Tax=Pithovirus LCPAC401 TaxID=2506595 RepID=A0A481ZBW2_9VIRU|nr:MAG: glycosyltransferase [Pithovirus LCPAC401]